MKTNLVDASSKGTGRQLTQWWRGRFDQGEQSLSETANLRLSARFPPKADVGGAPRGYGDDGRFVVIDFSVAGIWLAIEERDQFSAFLGQNNGSIPTLISHLRDLARNYK